MTKGTYVDSVKTSPKDKELPARKRQKTKDGTQDKVLAPGSVPESSDLAHTEFTEAFDLTGISAELKEKMYAVAPVLRGREAVYSKEFFTDVVGLCRRGVLLGKLVGFEEEIGIKWPVKKNHYEIAECLDSEEVVAFADHWSKVYGETPDNDYFSMRFLRGCYATLVHNIDVNWAQEALDWRHHRECKWDKNPKKLGTIALRQQIQAICKLVANIEASPDRGTRSLATAKEELQQCQEAEVKSKNQERELLKKLKDAREGLEECYAAEESGDLHVRYSKAIAEAKTLRTTGNVKEASTKRAEAEALLTEINESSEKSKKFEATIADIEEELLPQAMAELKCANESVKEAEARVTELTTCPGCKNAMSNHPNPTDHVDSSDPPSPSNVVASVNLAVPNPHNAGADACPKPTEDCVLVEVRKFLPADKVCQCG